ncbi:MAG: RNA-binding S4 domain-containing protein [Phyllobacteriaceae bacterium]|nr:RNA-binding S4 domain-containing protein [Phyllobacteriaceae bacterium]
MDGDRQRIDRWLWHARVVKTRELAKTLVEGGHVRVDRERETKAGAAIKPGQVLTVTLPGRVRVLKVVGFVERRGSAEVAATTYEDLSPPPPPRETRVETAPVGEREDGAGRPTKRDRRALDRLREGEE